MRSIKFTHVSLVAGLTLGIMALWAGAAPIGAIGDLMTGGWTTCTTQENVQVAATWSTCDPCNGVLLRHCYEGGFWGPCSGGMVTVVVASSAGWTPHATGGSSCYGGDGCDVDDGACY